MVKSPVYQAVSSYVRERWGLLTSPSHTLINPTQRRQAQFLAGVVSIIMPIVLITSVFRDISIEQGNLSIKPPFWINIAALLIGVVVYSLSRTRYYMAAAYLTVLTGSVAVLLGVFSNKVLDPNSLVFLVLPVLLSSILLSFRATLFCIVIQVVVVIGIAYLHPEMNSDVVLYQAIRFQVFAGVFVLLGMYYRNRIEREQSVLIEQNEKMLRASNEELEKGVAERTAAYQMATEELVSLLTERERYEQDLAKERNLLRTVIDNVPDHIFVLDTDGRYILVNKSLADSLYHGERDAFIGKNVYEISPSEQSAAYLVQEKALIESGQALLNIEQSSFLQTAPVQFFLASKLPLRDTDGQVIGLVGIARDVTERKETEKRLQQSNNELENRVAERTAELSRKNNLLQEYIADREKVESQLQYQANLLENVSDAIISVDYRFNVRSWNRAAEIMYGWDEAEAVGRNAFELTSANITPKMADAIFDKALTSGSWRGETEDKRRDGSKLNVMSSLSLLRDAHDEVLGMVLVNRDVTERKQVEAAEHEQRLLAEALRDTSAAINSTLKLFEVLDLILTYVGRVLPYDSASIMLLDGGVARVEHARGFVARGIDMRDILALRLPVQEHTNLEHMFRTGTAFIIPDTKLYPEWRVASETTWIHSNMGAPIRVGGKVIGFVNLDSAIPNHFTEKDATKLQAFSDQAGIAIHNANLFAAITRHASDLEARVTERTAELVNERAQVQAIMDAMSEGVYGVLFGEKPIRYANRSFVNLTGYMADEWTFDLLKPTSPDVQSDFRRDLDDLYDSMTSGMVWEGRGPVQCKDGRVFDGHLILTRIDNQDGKPVGIVTILRDVSQEKALEQQKSLFVANASHELRTPITNMMTRLYLIRKQPEALETHLQVLDEVARRMRTLVEDLLDHSRFERGVIPLEPQLMDVLALVKQVVNLQVTEADKKLINLTATLPETPLIGMVDPERMIQVITNLTINAIHYTPEGGQIHIKAELVQAADGQNERIRIHVKDTGVGVPMALLPNLFKPFFRVSEKTKGTGLGLSIARDIVRAHDGDIMVESVTGSGSCFTIDIPAAVKSTDID